jgi:polyhydroxyalkanoate synthesis regulator protein
LRQSKNATDILASIKPRHGTTWTARTVKTYAGQRLYRPATGTYLTCGDLMTMAKNHVTFIVIDAGTGDDVTAFYRPIIVEH